MLMNAENVVDRAVVLALVEEMIVVDLLFGILVCFATTMMPRVLFTLSFLRILRFLMNMIPFRIPNVNLVFLLYLKHV